MWLEIFISWGPRGVYIKNGKKFRGSRLNYEKASKVNGAYGSNAST